MTRWRTLVVMMSVGILTAGHSALFAQRPQPAAALRHEKVTVR